MSGKSGGVIYICGDEEGQRRAQRSAQRVGSFGRKLRLELLDTIKEQTVATVRSPAVRSCRWGFRRAGTDAWWAWRLTSES